MAKRKGNKKLGRCSHECAGKGCQKRKSCMKKCMGSKK